MTGKSLRRVAVLSLGILAVSIVPFFMVGEWIEVQVSHLLNQILQPHTLFIVGVGLLVVDVLLPIPSSFVSIGLCWSLGPWLGGLAIALGMTMGFVSGYWIGYAFSSFVQKRTSGAQAAKFFGITRNRPLIAIAITRPLPVLSEAIAMMSGVFRVPFLPALVVASLSSTGVGAIYAISISLARIQPNIFFAVSASLAFPCLCWLIQRALRKGDKTQGTPPVHQQPLQGIEPAIGNFSRDSYDEPASKQAAGEP